LKAIGTEVSYPKAKIDWEKFIELNCLLKLNTATTEEYILFFQKVLDPENKGLVPK
jgi:hypothetical protein